MVRGLIGRKLGMTQIFDEQGLARPGLARHPDDQVHVDAADDDDHPKRLARREPSRA